VWPACCDEDANGVEMKFLVCSQPEIKQNDDQHEVKSHREEKTGTCLSLGTGGGPPNMERTSSMPSSSGTSDEMEESCKSG